MTWWASDLFHKDPASLMFWVFWVLFSITLHELGHGWAALRAGDRTPIDTGHMTWNPVVHMGPISLILFALVGICWGAMPVDPSRFRRRFDDVIVSMAGPAMNVLLVIVCFVGGALWQAYATSAGFIPDNVWIVGDKFFSLGLTLNVALFLLNMVPIPPLDGSHVLAHYSAAFRRLMLGVNAGYLAMIAFGVVFLTSDRWLWPAARFVSDRAMPDAAQLLPGAAPMEQQLQRIYGNLTEDDLRAIMDDVRRSADEALKNAPPAEAPPAAPPPRSPKQDTTQDRPAP